MYTSGSLALAAMELLVHLGRAQLLLTYRQMPVYIPESLVMHLSVDDLPVDWTIPAISPVTQAIGDQWLVSRESAVLQVPSVVVPQEYNFILNPEHPDFKELEFGPIAGYRFDERL